MVKSFTPPLRRRSELPRSSLGGVAASTAQTRCNWLVIERAVDLIGNQTASFQPLASLTFLFSYPAVSIFSYPAVYSHRWLPLLTLRTDPYEISIISDIRRQVVQPW